jgi:3-oxoacyl-[acyl-carrier protein] reductase
MKYAVVTGGSKGIGKQISIDLLHKGYFVITNYSSDELSAHDTKLSFNEISNDFCIIKSDQSKVEDVNGFIEKIKELTNEVHCIVCNTGITIRKDANQFSNSEWEKAFQVNVHSHYNILRDLDNQIQPDSRIIFIGSVLGELPHATSLVYGVTKSAIHSMAKNLVKFFANRQITVNVVAPGFVETEWQKEKPAEIRNNIYAKTAISRFATVNEISQVCMMIVENQFINGEIINVDGGYNYK